MITIYGKQDCVYCQMAKSLLEGKNIPYVYVPLDEPDCKFNITMEQLQCICPTQKPVTTIPQIFDNGDYIGGYEDLEKYYG